MTDDTIAVCSFPTIDGSVEYRVIHAQTIENLDYGTQQEQDAYRAAYCQGAKVYTDKTEAYLEARTMLDIADEIYPVEYGIQHLVFDRPLVKMSEE